MNFQRYLVLASLLVSGLAAAGCADVPDDSTEVGGSEDELKAQAQKFVGDYRWDRGSTFTDFEHLSLKADGSYKASVESSLVKKVVCVAFPCTQPEAGKWTTTTDAGKVKLKFTPNNNKPTRSYFASVAKSALSLTRFNKTTMLLSTTGASCAAMLCGPGTNCVEGPNGGECVPNPTCAQTLCAAGSVCQDTANGPKCVQDTPCVVSGCSSEICAEQAMFSPCIFKPEFACYKKTACERQADGQCGWTMTPAVKACLANP